MSEQSPITQSVVDRYQAKLKKFQETLDPAEEEILACMLGCANESLASVPTDVQGYDHNDHNGFWYKGVWYTYDWMPHFQNHPNFHHHSHHHHNRHHEHHGHHKSHHSSH